jgi:homoserine kinase type II
VTDPELLARIAHEFGLGRVVSSRTLAEGIMNLSWRLDTDTGSYAVKLLCDRSPDEIRAAHRLMPRLAARGFPVAEACHARDGDTVVRAGDDWFTAGAWLPGTHARGDDLDVGRCAGLGELVGRLHLALAGLLPPAPRSLPDTPSTAAGARAALGRYAQVEAADEFDLVVHKEIAWRQALLDDVADQRPAEREIGPCGWTHGDLQHFNLLVDAGHISGILDWDRLGVRPYGLEVVRTATITFSTDDQSGLDLEKVAAFVRGYRAHVPISDADLIDAADRRWWTLLTETWPLKRHYDDNDQRCDHLFALRGNFVRWWTAHRRELAAALTAGPSQPSSR